MTHIRTCLAIIGNPASDHGHGGHTTEQVHALFAQAGKAYDFDVLDLTGPTYEQSAQRASQSRDDYDYLVVIGGDGMVSLGVNAIRDSGKPLGIVAVGSGNDFSRGLGLPIDRIGIAVEGIVGAIARHSCLEIDMGVLSWHGKEDQYFAGMLSCGLDASINDRANHSRLPNGTLRYLSAVLVELTRMRPFGYHVRAELPDGSIDEREIVSPLLTVANSRHVGGGIELSPYSLFSDGLLDMVWLTKTPSLPQIAHAIANIYNGKLLDLKVFGWQRVSSVEITRSEQGAQPPVLMADGEAIGELPIRAAVANRTLNVLVPPAVAEHATQRDAAYIDGLLIRDGRG